MKICINIFKFSNAKIELPGPVTEVSLRTHANLPVQ